MPPARARTILHVDLDAFYASVEQRERPELRGKPVIVGGPSMRGIVCAASYEARPFGVRSAMPMVTAVRLCPQGVVVRPRMALYAEVSAAFFAVLHRYSPLVEGLSFDEAFLDVTGEERLFGDGPTIGRAIKAAVRAELSIVASVGVAPSKFLAKIASDLKKPDALVVVRPGEELAFLHPLPVGKLWGVGKVTEQALATLSLRTIGDVARVGEAWLAPHVGREHAHHLAALARAEDDRDVVPERAPVSMGHEDTFERDVHARPDLITHILDQADRSCRRLREHGLRARVVTLKIKYADHERLTRRTTLARASADGRTVAATARKLLDEVPDVERRGVRLTGVSLSELEDRHGARQLSLADLLGDVQADRGEKLGDALDAIAARFGDAAVRRAVHVGAGEKLQPPAPRVPRKPGDP